MALNKNRRGEDSDRPASESSEFLDDVIRDLRSVATAGYRENIRAIVFKVFQQNILITENSTHSFNKPRSCDFLYNFILGY